MKQRTGTDNFEVIDILDSELLAIPGVGIKRTVFSKKVEFVIDQHFFLDRDKESLSAELTSTTSSIVGRLTFLTREEYDLIMRQRKEILQGFNGDIELSHEFRRAYEGFFLLKEIQTILNAVQIDRKQLATLFREGMKREPNRENILWLLHECIMKCTIIV